MSGISKRVSGSWVSGDYGIMGTSTDTITTLPAVLYPNDTTATVGLKGNMQQTGTPTPSNPIQPSECGDLETTGEKVGQYKIPILSNITTTPVYLGEVETTRRIKKFVLTGNEEWTYITGGKHWTPVSGYQKSGLMCICSHYEAVVNASGSGMVTNGQVGFYSSTADRLLFCDTNYTTTEDWKTYLAQQYANGTPVTVWYVLAEPTTGIVNEPIRKIGDYADTVSGITIPTIAGANSFDVLTTLKPSEVTANYHGWHTGAVHERDSGQWD